VRFERFDRVCFVLRAAAANQASCTLQRPDTSPIQPTNLISLAPHAPPPQGWIDRSILDRTRALLLAANLPVTPPPTMTTTMFKELMSVDKKVLAGKLRLVLLKGPLGGCVVTGDFDPSKLDETLSAFCAH